MSTQPPKSKRLRNGQPLRPFSRNAASATAPQGNQGGRWHWQHWLPSLTATLRQAPAWTWQRRHWWGSGLVVLLTMGAMRSLVIDSYLVTLPTMRPTLQPGDRLLIDKASYQWRNPDRGELVAFMPPGAPNQPRGVLVNRAVGLPGDRVEIQSGQLLVNQRPIAHGQSLAIEIGDLAPVRVPAATYFVMSDGSALGTAPALTFTYGYVPRQALVGRVMWRFFPLDRWGAPTTPTASPDPVPQ